MAVQPFTQMIWGKPTIKIDFTDKVVRGQKFLFCNLVNPPKRGRKWRFLGVRRESASEVYALVSITEAGTNKIVVPAFMPQIFIGGMQEQRVSIPPSILGANITIAFSTPQSQIIVPKNDERQELEVGVYEIDVVVSLNEQVFASSKRLTIASPHSIYWN